MLIKVFGNWIETENISHILSGNIFMCGGGQPIGCEMKSPDEIMAEINKQITDRE